MWRFASKFVFLAILLTGLMGFSPAVASKVSLNSSQLVNPLFDNLRLREARWSLRQEYAFVERLLQSAGYEEVHSLICRAFAAPNGRLYYFGIDRSPYLRHPIFIANHDVFLSYGRFRKHIHDLYDFELIGANLGFYKGPITVLLPR